MPRKKADTVNTRLALLVLCAFILTLIAAGLTVWQRRVEEPPPEKVETELPVPIAPPQIIEYIVDEESEEIDALTEKRKAALGVETGIDLIVKADETIKIGGTLVPMREILDRIMLKRGEIIEGDIDGKVIKETDKLLNGSAIDAYGIHVIQPGDNIWNIHFHFLRDYFTKRGITLSPLSDEAKATGYSSGVGKLLKFSENMVYIYNIRDRKLDVDLNLIHPLTKVIVFDMGRVFALLDQMDIENVNRIQFDGETLWIPAIQ